MEQSNPLQPRLKSGFWVTAYLRRLQLNNIAVFVTKRGDADAGAVLVKSNSLDGNARLFQRSIDIDGNRTWQVLAEGPEQIVDEAIGRQRGFDQDIWVLEVEDKQGRTLLDESGLNS